ncbi:dNTP triphosphohydrolase, broad substrate specificity [hydrothermal vent metagenome]|uniref:DNTP triphosphohydrolase, broad substrate specificity n=1 Tax=hydrothermal vent metagenome TaxID=652676 RepID=A0A3B1DP12_9ZZZZ
MRTRKDIEILEKQILAPYAMKSKDSAGRRHQESKHSVRTCYQRDRDRIVHSEAFRKLEYKTQVFVIFEGDYYRTRLTHTIEVAQIARTIGRSLCLNEDLIEAIALAHDLGHPPFGHAGEYALNAIMKEANVEGFNHNVRSFEIVTKFEKRYPEFDGLNLTEEVLVGILKHETVYDKPGIADQYMGKGPTLEAKVVDIADSVAYLSHDIDDGLTSGCIVEEDLMDSVLWQKTYGCVKAQLPQENKEMVKYQIVKALIDLQIKDLLSISTEKLESVDFQSSDDVKNCSKEIIGFSAQMVSERDALQKLLNEKVYHHYRVERMTSKATRIINDLFKVYVQNPRQLPYTIWSRNVEHNKQKKYEVICNYIASMTDRFALDEHKKLFNPYQKV